MPSKGSSSHPTLMACSSPSDGAQERGCGVADLAPCHLGSSCGRFLPDRDLCSFQHSSSIVPSTPCRESSHLSRHPSTRLCMPTWNIYNVRRATRWQLMLASRMQVSLAQMPPSCGARRLGYDCELARPISTPYHAAGSILSHAERAQSLLLRLRWCAAPVDGVWNAPARGFSLPCEVSCHSLAAY